MWAMVLRGRAEAGVMDEDAADAVKARTEVNHKVITRVITVLRTEIYPTIIANKVTITEASIERENKNFKTFMNFCIFLWAQDNYYYFFVSN